MATAQTYLQLSPEFGGTKFGPFQGVEIRLGSDPTRNDIVLPEALGVSPEHVRILMQNDGSFIVAPTTRTATVFLWKGDGRAPKQITVPTAVNAGDAFSVVTAEGPRFYILMEQPKKGGGADDAVAPPPAEGSGKAEGVWAEIKRVGLAKAMSSKAGNMFQTGWMMVKSGAIFSPRYIVLGMMMIVPLIMAGGASCAALGMYSSLGAKDDEIEEMKGDLADCGVGEEGEDPTVMSLTEKLLVDREWGQTLEQDPKFNQAYMERLKTIFERADKYAWVYKRTRSDVATMKKAFDSSFNSEGLTRVFTYIAAQPGYVPDREWSLVRQNSEGTRACGRGPLLMTFQQALNLDVSSQPDALVERAIAESEDLDVKATEIKRALGEAERDFENDEIQSEGVAGQGAFQCLYIEGDDDRKTAKALAKALNKQLGPSARGLPEENDDHWITARLLKFYAADFVLGFDDLELDSGVPTNALDDFSATQQDFVLSSAAEVTARAVAIPCLAVIEEVEAEHLGAPPKFIHCAILRALLDRSGA